MELLYDNGYRQLEDIAAASPEELAEIIGSDGPDAEQLVACAIGAMERLREEAEQARLEAEESGEAETEAEAEAEAEVVEVAEGEAEGEKAPDAEGVDESANPVEDEKEAPADSPAAD